MSTAHDMLLPDINVVAMPVQHFNGTKLSHFSDFSEDFLRAVNPIQSARNKSRLITPHDDQYASFKFTLAQGSKATGRASMTFTQYSSVSSFGQSLQSR